MAIKDFFSWLTGDDSRDAWPKGTSEYLPPKDDDAQDPKDPGVETMEWSTKTKTMSGGAAPDVFSDAFFADARRDMDRMREQMAKTNGFGKRLPSQKLANLAPKIDETSRDYTVSVDLAGYAEKDVKVEVLDNTLVVTAEKCTDREDGDNMRRTSEHFVNRLQRRVALERPIDASTLSSSFENGVLRLTIQKKN